MYAMSYLTTLFIIVTLNRIQTLVKSTLGPGIGKPEFLPSIFETLRSGSCSTRKTSLKWQRDLSHHTHVVPLLKLTDKNLPSASTKLLTEHRGHLNLVKRLLANKYVRWCTYFTGLEGESKRREKKETACGAATVRASHVTVAIAGSRQGGLLRLIRNRLARKTKNVQPIRGFLNGVLDWDTRI